MKDKISRHLMRTKLFTFFAHFVLFFCAGSVFAGEFLPRGRVFFRPQAEHGFSLLSPDHAVNKPGMMAVQPDVLFPLASNTGIIVASHSLTLYPGAMLKFDGSRFMLLGGRILIENDNQETDPIEIVGSRFSARLYHGSFLAEMTPENTFWLAMQKQGDGWLKDQSRKIVEFKPGTEVELPPFSESKVKDSLSPRWDVPPELAVISDIEAVFSEPAIANDDVETGSDDLASGPAELATDSADLDQASDSPEESYDSENTEPSEDSAASEIEESEGQ